MLQTIKIRDYVLRFTIYSLMVIKIAIINSSKVLLILNGQFNSRNIEIGKSQFIYRKNIPIYHFSAPK